MGILLAILASMGYASSRVLAAVGLKEIKPLTIALISGASSLVMALVLTLVFEFEELFSVSLAAIGWFALLGINNYVFARSLTFAGIKHIGASRSTPIYATFPLFTMVFARAFLKESITPTLWLGALLIVAGLVILLSEGEQRQPVSGGGKYAAGIIFSLASAAVYGIGTVITKWGVTHLASPLVGATLSLTAGTLVLFLVAGKDFVVSTKAYRREAAFSAFAGLAAAIGLISMYVALSIAPAVIVTPLSGTSPLFTVLGTHLFLRKFEKVTNRVVLSVVMVVVGGILVSTS